MRVTMNIFSGRPNPTWSLPRRKTTELVDRLSVAGPLLAAHQPPILGFRGFTLDADLEDLAMSLSVPAHFVLLPPTTVEVVDQPRPRAKQRASAAAAVTSRHATATSPVNT